MTANPTTFSIAVIVVLGTIASALITGWLQRVGKRQDYERQDAVAAAAVEVAAEAKRQQDEVARLAAEDRRQAEERQEEVARLLVAAQATQKGATDEVARLAAGDGVRNGLHVSVTLSYPNGNRQAVVLAEVPRVGENIRLSNGAEEPWLIVDHVLWVEGTDPPHVIVSVHPLKSDALSEVPVDDRRGR